MDADTKAAVLQFIQDALGYDYGKSKTSILAGAKRYFKVSRLTPDQIKAAMAMIIQYLPMLIALLGGK